MDRAGHLLLRTLHETGPLSQHALAERVGLDASTVTRQVDCLEREGFARRRPSATDRRSWIVEPTELGRRLMHEMQRQRCERVDRVLTGWSDAERWELGRTLARLNRAIAAHPLIAGLAAAPDVDAPEIRE